MADVHTTAPCRRYKGHLDIKRELFDLPAVQLTQEGETGEEALTARLCRKGEIDEGTKVPAKIRILPVQRVQQAMALKPLKLDAVLDRLGDLVGPIEAADSACLLLNLHARIMGE